MFSAVGAVESRRTLSARYISVALHCILLYWLVHSPNPVFVAPASAVRGEGGRFVTQLYWPGRKTDSGPGAPELAAPVSLQHRDARARVEWAQPPKPGKGRKREGPPSEVAANTKDSEREGLRAGSAYSSLLEGSAGAEDIKPALPIAAADPMINPAELPGGVEGDIVVEITIDEAGNIIAKRVLVSLGPAIDAKVLEALESWHFRPATRDSIPVPSKQDVHYHFKPR
jgi:TonB family protein